MRFRPSVRPDFSSSFFLLNLVHAINCLFNLKNWGPNQSYISQVSTKNSPLLLLGWLGCQGNIENFWNFSKVSYIWRCFFHASLVSYNHRGKKFKIKVSVHCSVRTKKLINMKVTHLLVLAWECTFSQNRLKYFSSFAAVKIGKKKECRQSFA